MRPVKTFTFLVATLVTLPLLAKEPIELELTLPKLKVNPYHKPFVAVWLETTDRQYVTTVSLWANDMEWYKDLRQWWRKAGRSEQPFDAVTGATQKPGTYTIQWRGTDGYGQKIPAGNYILKVEASREEGGREYLKTPITLNQNGEVVLAGQDELGKITIRTHK